MLLTEVLVGTDFIEPGVLPQPLHAEPVDSPRESTPSICVGSLVLPSVQMLEPGPYRISTGDTSMLRYRHRSSTLPIPLRTVLERRHATANAE